MTNKILALKYRPQEFKDLIGQEVMAQTITNAIKLGKTPNKSNFLFMVTHHLFHILLLIFKVKIRNKVCFQIFNHFSYSLGLKQIFSKNVCLSFYFSVCPSFAGLIVFLVFLI